MIMYWSDTNPYFDPIADDGRGTRLVKVEIEQGFFSHQLYLLKVAPSI